MTDTLIEVKAPYRAYIHLTPDGLDCETVYPAQRCVCGTYRLRWAIDQQRQPGPTWDTWRQEP